MKIIDIKNLSEIINTIGKKKIVHCHGVFDLFHYGHLLHLRSAKKFGDVLIVSITPDIYVHKGPNRPLNNQFKRANFLAELEIVDYVIINNQPDAIKLIEIIKPNFYIKGLDYVENNDITGKLKLEQDSVERYGGRLVFTDDELSSSSNLINQYFQTWSDQQKSTLSYIKATFSYDQIEKIINKLSSLNVLVVGETIIDTYRFCEPQNISSKSPSISAKFIREENYAGGSLAIARHLKALGLNVALYAPYGVDDVGFDAIEKIKQEIKVINNVLDGYKTPRKIRYVTQFGTNRIFEVTEINDEFLEKIILNDYSETLMKAKDNYDLILFSDFGHGLFEKHRLKQVNDLENIYKSVNIQTNSSNFGFNLSTKYNNVDYVSIDEREFRLANANRYDNLSELIQKNKIVGINKIIITLGSRGCIDAKSKDYVPTFIDMPVDTTGAGDAFYAITSVLNFIKIDNLLTMFMGNVYAGLKTKIVGNKDSVDKINLLRTVKAILA